MSVTYRAEDEPVRSRLDYWRHVLSNAVIPVEIRFPQDFRARIVTGEVGAVRVTESTGPAGACFRTDRFIRRSDPDLYAVVVLARGSGALVEHNGRRSLLAPGDFTLVDPSRPFFDSHPEIRHVAVTFPRSILPLCRDDVARLAGARLRGDHGSGALVSALLRRLPRHLDDPGVADGARLGTTVVDLVTTVLADRLDAGAGVPPEVRQRALLARIHSFIEERLADPELSPAMVADAHHISLRYLYKLFQAERTTVAGWIRQRRLERVRHDLLDPAQAVRSINTLAARWGFTTGAHFNRAFRTAYGIPPGEYRTAHAHPAHARTPANGRPYAYRQRPCDRW